MVDQLLSAARLGQGVDTVDEDIDFVGLVHDLVSDMAPLAIRSGRQIEFCAGAAARVRGDSEGLRSAIANLIDNALRAEPEGGGVAVSVRTGVEGRVAVEVSDHGPGVARHDRELAFEPFWRKDNHHPGAGLGLSIALEIARRHEGVLSIHDTPGGGATFRLDLPGGGFARTHPAISAVHS